MNIIYEDEYIVVCEKPRAVLSQRDAKGNKNMVDLLSDCCNCTIFPVHRLDKDVGGVMVFAKTSKAAAVLSEQIANRTAKKCYLALSRGTTENNTGTMEDLLFFDKGKNKSFVVKKQRRGVKKAQLEYEFIKSINEVNLFKVKLLTGRTHQIRIQFASRKMPLCGDRRYGAKDNEKSIALWSYKIEFNHPKTEQKMSFEVIPYEDEMFKAFFESEHEL